MSTLSAEARAGLWRPLPDPEWQPTIRSVHRWSQIVGKVRLALAQPINHWWHVTLYVTARGLTTSAIPYGSSLLELEFDFLDHVLIVRLSDGTAGTVRLRPMSVGDFYVEVGQLLTRLGVNVRIWPVPVEVVEATPFADDVAPGGYDPEHARALHGALINSHRVLTRFRSGFIGKSSPVHFFWGGFDIAVTSFSGRPAPRHPGGVPNCPDYVQHEAYSHEVSSAGWWPGSNGVPPAFYAYVYPEPPGFATAAIKPAEGLYQQDFREFILPYLDVVESEDPDATVLAFLESTYVAGATLGGWDREALERGGDRVQARAGHGGQNRGAA